MVRDSGNPVLSSTASIVIRILDENDHIPMLLLPGSEIQIMENQNPSIISTILAMDRDADDNGTAECHIIGKVQCFIMTNISKPNNKLFAITSVIVHPSYQESRLISKAVLFSFLFFSIFFKKISLCYNLCALAQLTHFVKALCLTVQS